MTISALNRTGVSRLTNKSGSDVLLGTIVVLDPGNSDAFTTVAIEGYTRSTIGVVVEPNGIVDNESGMIATWGWVPQINLDSSAGVNDHICTASTAGEGTPKDTPCVGEFAQALGSGTAPAALLGVSPDPAWPARTFSGLELANNGSDANNDIDVAVGGCRDDSDAVNIRLAASITKQLDASWAAGTNAGGLDTGSKASSTWYHVFLIRKDVDGSADVLFSTSYASPTMPSGYTYKRLVGSIKTDGSGNILPFLQSGNVVTWYDYVKDVDTTIGTSRTLVTLGSVPPGYRTRAIFNPQAGSGNAGTIQVQSPYAHDTSVAAGYNTGMSITLSSIASRGFMILPVNTSQQLAARATAASQTLAIFTRGWEYIR